MDFSGFLSGFLADLLAGLLVLLVGYLIVEHYLNLRERAANRDRVLRAVLGELYSNAAGLVVAVKELPTGGVPFPLFDLGMWHVLSQASIFTTLRHETVSALMHAYNRMESANGQCSALLELHRGQTAILAMSSFAGRLDDPQVAGLHDAFQQHRVETRDLLLDRLADLDGYLNQAIDAVEAEVGEQHPVPAERRVFLSSAAGPDGRPVGTPRSIVKVDRPEASD